MDKMNRNKWENYYDKAIHSNEPPPWESSEPFSGLVEFFESHSRKSSPGKCVEFGSGSSSSSIYLAEQGYSVDAVDISALAIERAKTLPNAHLVNWIEADLLVENLFPAALKEGSYDLVFDMQCFHVLRLLNESTAAGNIARALKPGGVAVVVVGASLVDPNCTTDTSSTTAHDDHTRPGPPLLTLDELRVPLEAAGLTTVQLALSRFNLTPNYANLPGNLPPLAWMGVFQRLPWSSGDTYALEVQAPFSTYILQGRKSIETRAYALPKELLNRPIYLLESAQGTDGVSSVGDYIPATSSSSSASSSNVSTNTTSTAPTTRIIGTVVFTSCTQYISQAAWEADRPFHMVPLHSTYDYCAATGVQRFTTHDAHLQTQARIGLKEGRINELYAWNVGFYEASVPTEFPALQRVYRSIFKTV